MSWLVEAIRLLAQLHGKTFPVPADLPASTRRFDRQKYYDEFLFTFEHLTEKLLHLDPLTTPQLEIVGAFCERISSIAPDVFSHRDYHTRNILVREDKLYLIDFQDARLGSPHYDLASLLYDAYVPVSDAERSELLLIYEGEMQKYPLYSSIDWNLLEPQLAEVAFQRVVKAAGSFASFFTRHGKSTHLPYLLPALNSARTLLESTPSLPKELKSIFKMETWLRSVSQLKI